MSPYHFSDSSLPGISKLLKIIISYQLHKMIIMRRLLVQGALLSQLLEEPLRLATLTASMPPPTPAPTLTGQQLKGQQPLQPPPPPPQRACKAAAAALREAVGSRAAAALRSSRHRNGGGQLSAWGPAVCVVAAPPPALGLAPGVVRRTPSGAASWRGPLCLSGPGSPWYDRKTGL